MQQSLLYENIMTAMTLLGLFIIILFGFGQINLPLIIGNTPAENSFSLVNSVFAAAALVFFAYLGFENIANISEETIDSKKNTPKAITFALAFVTVLYVLIALISTSVVAPEQLAIAADPNQPLTEGPLALVAEKVVMPGFGFWLSVFALFATASTIIALLNVSSRILYGLSSQGLFPKVFRELDQKGVPINAILFILFATIVLGLIGNLSLLGNLTTANTFLLFFAVNSSLIVLKLNERKPEKKHKFEFVEEKVLQFEAMPITAILGAGFCLLMFLTQFWQPVDFFGIKMPLILFNLGILLLALLVYKMKRD
jgi:APA family basic amino acid/polyamine antiporter